MPKKPVKMANRVVGIVIIAMVLVGSFALIRFLMKQKPTPETENGPDKIQIESSKEGEYIKIRSSKSDGDWSTFDVEDAKIRFMSHQGGDFSSTLMEPKVTDIYAPEVKIKGDNGVDINGWKFGAGPGAAFKGKSFKVEKDGKVMIG